MLQQIYPTPEHNFEFELNKDMHFSAAHYIPHEAAGSCKEVHGHTYFANITIGGDQLDDSGFLINFQHIKNLIHKRFDHSIMNNDTLFSDSDSNKFPTTEVVAKTMCKIIQSHLDTLDHRPQCLQVFLRETPTSYVIYRPKKGRVS
ncbi:6-carboxytetrahydropterin synthase [Rossellomorea aquimaris]|uniref:6-carboxytetrahydropterin synthase n=1 Tax=Rossellomorea aquimaris TaxID=189382 RepID=UPI0007D04FA5|nr:6-carboxytetrahydropterin synthase [Rossellomorea aquimaris]